MRAVMLAVPEAVLEERRRTGADLFDEVWEGTLHMVPPPSEEHQGLSSELFLLLAPLAKAAGLLARFETGLYRPGNLVPDYRTPDLLFAPPSLRSKRGIEGAASLVIEILSPDDETYDKIPFYESLGVGELLIVSPGARTFELYVHRERKLVRSSPNAEGQVTLASLGTSLATVPGPRLRLLWPGGQADI